MIRGDNVMRLILALMGASASLAGCATTSFAPPSVNLENEMEVVGSNYSFGQRCMPNQRYIDVQKDGKNVSEVLKIKHDATGAQRLIDNFVYMYRCRAHSAANGRQAFEVPALLTGVGTAAAAAFGASPDVAIAGGTATALFGAGKSYYAPQQKAEVFDSALDAVLCIKAEAVGVDPITIEKMGNLEAAKAQALQAANGNVVLTTDEQFYEMITTALLSVERVLAQRLSTIGSFDPAGVVAEIKALSKEAEDKIEAAKPKADAEAAALLSTNQSTKAAVDAVVPPADVTAAKATIAATIVRLSSLQPKLQQCVVRAKI